LDDCLQGGQCNEEICAFPPTPCQLCKQRADVRDDTCRSECQNGPPDDYNYCQQECDYQLVNHKLNCYENRGCCEDFSQRSPASLLGQLRMKSMRRNAPLQPANYRRPQRLNIPVRNVAQQSPYNGRDDKINPMLARYY
jgi:hypothetical protein